MPGGLCGQPPKHTPSHMPTPKSRSPLQAAGRVVSSANRETIGRWRATLSRFHAFVHNKTAATLRPLELRYLRAIQQIRETEVSPVAVSQALNTFQSEDESFTQIMTESLEVVQRRKDYLLSLASDSEKPELVNLVSVDTTALRAASTNLAARATAVDNSEFNRARKETVEQRNALSALIELAKHKEALKRQVMFLQERYRIPVAEERNQYRTDHSEGDGAHADVRGSSCERPFYS